MEESERCYYFVLSRTRHNTILSTIHWDWCIIIISLLMSPLLGHRPSLWITIRSTGHAGPVRLVDANDCKCSRAQRLNVLSEARRSSSLLIFGHPSNDRSTLLNFRNRTPKCTDRGPSDLSTDSSTNVYKNGNIIFTFEPPSCSTNRFEMYRWHGEHQLHG
jgi:hypothetical protein